MSFLTIIILGVITLQSSNLAMMNRQNNQIQAHFYANQGIQILKAIGYKDINDAYSGCVNPCYRQLQQSDDKYSIIQGFPEKISDIPFERTIEINNTDLTNAYNAYKVTVYIEWDDSTGPHRRTDNAHVQAKTIISE